MTRVLCLRVWVGVAVNCDATLAQKTRRTGDLKKARDHTTDGVLTLTDANFTAFAMEGPRPYGLAILFTARDEQYRCTHCAYDTLASHTRSVQLSAHPGAPMPIPPGVRVRVDVDVRAGTPKRSSRCCLGLT